MKLSKHFITLGAFALALSGASGLLLANKANANKAENVAEATSAYTIYQCDDLGFATRDPNDTRIVKGDSDGGMQTKGNALSEKSELHFTFKKTVDNYWIGIGGYAVYVSSSTTIRFLYLTYNSNGQYGRNIDLGNLKMKTADGSTNLADVDGGKLFTNYTDACLKIDLSNPSAPTLSFSVTFNGVSYYPFNGDTMISSYTYTNFARNFPAEDQYKAMAGAASNDDGVPILKFQSHVKSLDRIMSAGSATFLYEHIDNFFFSISLSEQIFNDTDYFNDHAGIDRFKDANNNFIDILNGLVINGQTFGYWKNYDASATVFPRNAGVTAFPMDMGSVFSPVSIQPTASALEFKTVVEVIPMDGMTITFKAGIFEGYCNGTTYVLNEDLTFNSVVTTTGAPARVMITKDTPWQTTRLGVKKVDDWGEKEVTGSGNKYHQYAMWTNIPRDDSINQGCPADNFRYMYDNLLLNGKTISHYHAWARGNSKDFTDLSNPASQNPAYELEHPTGGPSVNYDVALRVAVATDQPNYVFIFDIPNQMITDLSLTTFEFTLRDGADFLTPGGMLRYDAAGNAEDATIVANFAQNKLHLSDYNENLGYCNDAEHHYYLTAKEAFNQLTDSQKVAFQNNAQFAAARARYEAWAAFNNDAEPYDGNNTVVTTINAGRIHLLNSDSNNAVVIVVLATMLTSVVAVGALFLLRKRKAKQWF